MLLTITIYLQSAECISRYHMLMFSEQLNKSFSKVCSRPNGYSIQLILPLSGGCSLVFKKILRFHFLHTTKIIHCIILPNNLSANPSVTSAIRSFEIKSSDLTQKREYNCVLRRLCKSQRQYSENLIRAETTLGVCFILRL